MLFNNDNISIIFH